MAVNFNVVLLFGPPFSGKTRHCLKKYESEGFERICPKVHFLSNKSLGLRDISIRISRLLEKGKKVVIDDENSSVKTRQSYISFIRKKFPKSKFQLVKICPSGGYFQCMWSREFVLASGGDLKDISKDPHIDRWFDKHDSDISSFNNLYVDEPDAREGFSVEDNKSFLTAVTPVKFEVPALFVQWEGLPSDDDHHHTQRMAAVCKAWEEVNPCGRIFIVCDGRKVAKGLTTASDEESSIKEFMKQLISEVPIPVYVFQVHQPADAGKFCTPPNPGILAYLQKRHCLELHSRSTIYLYDSSDHKCMAEKAGVRHLKLGRVLHHPKLVVAGHAAQVPAVPPMLQTLVLESDRHHQTVQTPLYSVSGDFRNKFVVQNLPWGRREFLFARDTGTVDRYQALYSENATPLSETESRIAKLRTKCTPKQTSQLSSTRDVHPSSASQSVCARTASSRDLPKWMLGKRKSSLISSLEKSGSTNSTEGKIRKRETVYLMNEKEFIECAKELLKQAGREDILEKIENEKNPSDEDHNADINISTLVPEAAGQQYMRNTEGDENKQSEKRQNGTEVPGKDTVNRTEENVNSSVCATLVSVESHSVKTHRENPPRSDSGTDAQPKPVCTDLGDIGAMLDALF